MNGGGEILYVLIMPKCKLAYHSYHAIECMRCKQILCFQLQSGEKVGTGKFFLKFYFITIM